MLFTFIIYVPVLLFAIHATKKMKDKEEVLEKNGKFEFLIALPWTFYCACCTIFATILYFFIGFSTEDHPKFTIPVIEKDASEVWGTLTEVTVTLGFWYSIVLGIIALISAFKLFCMKKGSGEAIKDVVYMVGFFAIAYMCFSGIAAEKLGGSL